MQQHLICAYFVTEVNFTVLVTGKFLSYLDVTVCIIYLANYATLSGS